MPSAPQAARGVIGNGAAVCAAFATGSPLPSTPTACTCRPARLPRRADLQLVGLAQPHGVGRRRVPSRRPGRGHRRACRCIQRVHSPPRRRPRTSACPGPVPALPGDARRARRAAGRAAPRLVDQPPAATAATVRVGASGMRTLSAVSAPARGRERGGAIAQRGRRRRPRGRPGSSSRRRVSFLLHCHVFDKPCQVHELCTAPA